MSPSASLTIGAVADATGLAVSAIRYYDDIGLVPAARRVGGQRVFGDDAVGRVSFIRRAQDAGFTLEEVRAILDDQAGGWRDLVDSKMTELLDRRTRLDEMITMLDEVKTCGCDAVAQCPRLGE